MPRRQKPPGMERWTWREIDAGRKMTKGQRSAAHRWEKVSEAGPGYQALYIAILIFGVIIALVSTAMKH